MNTPHLTARNTRPFASTLTLLCNRLKALTLALVLATACATPTPTQAQCPAGWQPFDPSTASYPGISGSNYLSVRASTMWDPDGPGPIPPRLVIAGSFTLAGNTLANNIALYDPATGQWSPLGTGTSTFGLGIHALTTLPNGDLIAAGNFTTAGGVIARGIARWNGSAWSPLGTGMTGSPDPTIYSLTTLPNGDLIAGGDFLTAGGMPASNIARWNGSAWSPLGSGMNSSVYALTALPNGDLIAAGLFTTAGGVAVNRIARWNGSAWSTLGTGMNNTVFHLTTLPSGDLIAGGAFTNAGGVAANRIARWNGSAWSPLGTGVSGNVSLIPSQVQSIKTLPNGDIIAGGAFTTAGGVAANSIARWNGTAWSPVGTGVSSVAGVGSGFVSTLTTLPSGDLVAAGSFARAGEVIARGIARWNGSAWSPLSTGMTGNPDPGINSLTTLPNGNLIAAGFFTTAGGVAANNINSWNGSAWSPLGTGMNGNVFALTTLPNGDLIASGDFSTAGGVAAIRIARWNGSTWSPLGTGMDDFVSTLSTLPNGDIVAGGSFITAGGVVAPYIARYTFGTPAPAITTQPTPLTACTAGPVTFAVTPAGTGPFTYQWRKDTVAINTATNPSAATATLALANVQPTDAGSYDCIVTTPCGSVTSNAASLTVATCACGPSDIAGPGQSIGPDNALSADDIIVYLNWFFAGDTRADVAGPGQSTTPDSQFTADDIIVFLNRFFAGC